MASITVRQAQAQDAAVIQEMLEEAARWVDALGVVMWDEGELDPDRVAREAAEGQFFIAEIDGDPAGAAPLLCAGITTYSPLRKWKIGKGQKVGIVGLGGLGHMGVKFAHAFGAHTVLFTTSASKVADGRKLGADEVIISKNAEEMAKHAGSFDFILDTVSADHDINALLAMLRMDGTLVLVGVPENPHPTPNVGNLIFKRRAIAGSLIGGLPETQEMLDFCARHGIVADIEMEAANGIDAAYERMLRSDVKYRFVIDAATMAG